MDPQHPGRQRRRPDSLMLLGVTGGTVAFVLATYDVVVWTLAGLVAAAVWSAPTVNRWIRTRRGVGRHAA